MHETGSSSKNSLDNFICSVAEQSFCHRGVLLGAPRTGLAPAEKRLTGSKHYIWLKNTSTTSSRVRSSKPTGTYAIQSPAGLGNARTCKSSLQKQMESADEKNKKDIEERLCRSILTLGEVSNETENYSQAVEDIQMCLKKQESFPKDSRLVPWNDFSVFCFLFEFYLNWYCTQYF